MTVNGPAFTLHVHVLKYNLLVQFRSEMLNLAFIYLAISLSNTLDHMQIPKVPLSTFLG